MQYTGTSATPGADVSELVVLKLVKYYLKQRVGDVNGNGGGFFCMVYIHSTSERSSSFPGRFHPGEKMKV